MKIFAVLSITAALATLLPACSYETRHAQYSFAVRPSSEVEAEKLRASVQRFSNAEGFLRMTEAGNAEHLRKEGRYLFSFHSADNSFVTATNILKTDCYDIGIHSSASADAAKVLGKRLEEVLRSTTSAEFKSESACYAFR